jgi:hypothetical protein
MRYREKLIKQVLISWNPGAWTWAWYRIIGVIWLGRLRIAYNPKWH